MLSFFLMLRRTPRSTRTATLFPYTTLFRSLCGAFLGASVVFFRGAALALGDGEVIMRAAFALAVSLVMQTVIMGAYLLLREPGQMTAILRHWKPSLAVGVAGFLASVGWLPAFTSSAERRVGEECVRRWKHRGSP